MDLEELEMILAAELPKHLSGDWNAKVTDFGAAQPNDAVVELGEASFSPVPGVEETDPRWRPSVADEAEVELTITFNAPPQAPRTIFSNVRREVKAACDALTTARPENWAFTSMERRVDELAERPHRIMECSVSVETIVS